MRTITLLLTLLLTTMSHAAIKTETVEYRLGDVTMKGILAYDDAAKADEKRPGVLVCHEWWGCNDYSEMRARKLAELGYVAFALDVYGDGKTTTTASEASAMLGKVMADRKALRERAAAGLKVLAENKRTDPSRLAAIGYCMGGTVALELARSGLPHTANLKAIVCFHTSTIAADSPGDNRNIKGQVLICHGEADTFVKQEQIDGFKKQMADAGVKYTFESYPGAVHAFTNPGADKFGIDGVKYQEAADRKSWEAMKTLFASTLK